MKARHQEWLNLTAKGIPSKPTKAKTAVISLAALPGFADIERKILLYASHRGPISPELQEALDTLSIATFGSTSSETEFQLPDSFWGMQKDSFEYVRVEGLRRDFEAQFETEYATDDEIVEIMLGYGLDFRDTKGMPMLCTKHFSRQAEAAALGIIGKLPDYTEAMEARLGSSLENEAAAFLANKRKAQARG